MPRFAPPEIFVAAALLCVGGALLLAAQVTDETAAGLYLSIGFQGTAFGSAFTGALLAWRTFRDTRGWIALVLGFGMWLVCWSWPSFLAYVIPLPPDAIGLLAATSFAVGSVIAVTDSDFMNASVAGVLALGSLTTVAIMLANPVFKPAYTFTPVAIASVLGGLLWTGYSVNQLRVWKYYHTVE